MFCLTRPPSGGNGAWTEEVLHNFTGTEADGSAPNGLLLLGPSGKVYGTTGGGGFDPIGYGGEGVVYRLDNAPGWPIAILHTFRYTIGTSHDGKSPEEGLQFGPGGLLYGVIYYGSRSVDRDSYGFAFSVSPQGDATKYAVLRYFGTNSATDGTGPSSPLLPAGQMGSTAPPIEAVIVFTTVPSTASF